MDSQSSTRRYVRERMKKLGVDVSHFEREGVRWTEEVLRAAVSASTNTCEVLRHLGLEVVGGHHTHISRRIKAFGIDTSHFRMPTRKGKAWRPRTPEAFLVQQPSRTARRIPSDRLKWAITVEGVPEICALCGTDAVWRGRPLPLEVDHIDSYRGRGKALRRSGAV